MRELRACDFCGDDAVGVYEPLPPEVGSQRRVALCGACRDTLEDLLAPLEGEKTPAVTIDEGAGDEGDSGEPGGEQAPSTEGVSGEATETTRTRDDGGGPDMTGENPEDDTGANARSAEPDGFRKVMRLLNNRSFPLERTVAIELASGAYELSDSEVGNVLDYAVERGVLEESGGELHRG